MPMLYLISCRMFEDELVHIFEREDDNTRLLLIENENIQSFEKKLDEVSIDYEKISVAKLPPKSGQTDEFVVVLNILEFALGANPSHLKNKVYETIEEADGLFDGILVFYGLCGNALISLELDFECMGIPVRILKDAHGNVVDDCICASFEDKNAYIEAIMGDRNGKGTYFLTPMQAANWRKMLVLTKVASDPDNIKMMKRVFDYSGYNKVGKIDTGLCYEKKFDKTVDEFASIFDFKKVIFSGSTKITDDCYQSIKRELIPASSTKKENQNDN